MTVSEGVRSARDLFCKRVGGRAGLVIAAACLLGPGALAETPGVGAKAPDFTLATPAGSSVQLATEEQKGTVVLVILRGYPGYQCPYCQKQVHDFVEHAGDFAAKAANVVLVYPGPPADLDQHAKEFLAAQPAMPANVVLVTDPDYAVTNRYGLRWDAPRETAYPSTFIVDRKGDITFEKISRVHGDRTTAQQMLDQLAAK